ncbi:MAG: phosphatidate cytidylyltransferase [Candidatus Omnitrophota bacterium]
MLLKKIIASFLILTLTGLIIFLFPNWVFLMLTMAFIALATKEFFFLVERKGIFVYRYFGIVAACLIPVSVYINVGRNNIDLEPLYIVIACMFAFILHFVKRKNAKDTVISIAVTLLALFYIGWMFSFFVKLKFLPGGSCLVAYLVLVTKMGDVAAYFGGRILGKHKLIPRISPNKTVEGTVCGLTGSVVMAVLAGGLVKLSPFLLVVLGVFLGVLAQAGDLAESLIKRDCGVKDAGSHISGFGGVFDIIDSLLFTAPIFYFFMVILLR